MAMLMTTEIGAGQLADLVKQVQAGNEVLLTLGDKPVARLVPATAAESAAPGSSLRVRSLAGHRVLTPSISQSQLADDLFDRP
jgi:antitoxin (DNA-binding transcriptional repressor) of toxin-antitoxin stability system